MEATTHEAPAAPQQVIHVTTVGKQTSGMAITGFILSLVGISALGVIFSAIALPKTKTEMGGRGLAIAGLVLGILGSIGWVLMLAGAFAGAEALDSYSRCMDAAQTLSEMGAC
jgi:hypothetical protein